MTTRTRRRIVLFALLVACWASACSQDRNRLASLIRQHAGHVSERDAGLIADAVLGAEQETGVDALLLISMIEHESTFRLRAKSSRGALGLLQVLPGTGRDVARRHGIDWDGHASLYDAAVNVRIGAIYLKELEARFGSWDLALTAYNRGPSRARRLAKRGNTPSSAYARRVLDRFELWKRRMAG